MHSRNHGRAGFAGARHVARRGIGAGVAVAMLASAAVATAAPPHATAAGANNGQARIAARPDSTIAVRPGTVKAGARVTIVGDAPTKARTGLWLTLQSFAFNSKTMVNGVPSVRTQVLANGTYSVSAVTKGGLKSDRYAVTGSFKGQPFSQVAWLQVHAKTPVQPDSTIKVRPGTVKAGSRVTIVGDAPTKARTGLWLTLQSFAFNSKTMVNGVPSVRTQVLANGTYSVSAVTKGGLKSDRYAVTGSFKGEPFSQVGWVQIHAL